MRSKVSWLRPEGSVPARVPEKPSVVAVSPITPHTKIAAPEKSTPSSRP